MALSVACAGGCASQPKSSVMTVEDYQYIATEMGGKLQGKLATSDVFAGRGGESPAMVVSIQKVSNLTSDMIPESARWYLMEKVKSSLPMAALSRDKNIRFVIPAEHLRQARERGAVEDDFANDRAPTHVMTATFLSATRAGGLERTDLYYCEYQLTDLSSGEVVWTDTVEFKRTAHGRSWD